MCVHSPPLQKGERGDTVTIFCERFLRKSRGHILAIFRDNFLKEVEDSDHYYRCIFFKGEEGTRALFRNTFFKEKRGDR